MSKNTLISKIYTCYCSLRYGKQMYYRFKVTQMCQDLELQEVPPIHSWWVPSRIEFDKSNHRRLFRAASGHDHHEVQNRKINGRRINEVSYQELYADYPWGRDSGQGTCYFTQSRVSLVMLLCETGIKSFSRKSMHADTSRCNASLQNANNQTT